MSEVPLNRRHNYPITPGRGGLVLKAHIWLYHSTLGSRVIKKKEEDLAEVDEAEGAVGRDEDVAGVRVAIDPPVLEQLRVCVRESVCEREFVCGESECVCL